jgi:hypothetical protein
VKGVLLVARAGVAIGGLDPARAFVWFCGVALRCAARESRGGLGGLDGRIFLLRLSQAVSTVGHR